MPKPDTLAILERLIAFDTTSHRSNLAMIDWVADYLKSLGVAAELQLDSTAQKANLLASIGPDEPGGVVLSGHSDVVPTEGQPWDSDPFTLTAGEGRFFGRGTADMKGFIACVLAAVPGLLSAGLRRPVHICLTYDEEVGCGGIQALIPMLKKRIPTPRLVVIGEPTGMTVANSHKSQHVYETRIMGRAAHSSRPDDGVNAVYLAAKLIARLEILAQEAKGGACNPAFDPPYTTVNVGPIKGGSAFNIVADQCSFEWDQRTIPGDDGSKVLGPYETLVAELDAEVKARGEELFVSNRRWTYLPALTAAPGSDAETLALSLAQANQTVVVGFGTEAGHIQTGLDWPVVVCGPGDIAQAHKANEYITKSELVRCEAFLGRLQSVLSS